MNKKNLILIGKKLGMTQFFHEGSLLPVTVVEAGPCPVSKICTEEKEGYRSVQIAFSEQKSTRLSAAELGHLRKAGLDAHTHLLEIKTENDYKLGDVLDVSIFQQGDFVDAIGTTKGHGFQGVMKRWGFAGGPASHGSMFHRRGGGYGCRQEPGEVRKNRKMPGQMGGVRRTVQNLQVVAVYPEKNIILIKGSFAGSMGSLVFIRSAKKNKY